MRMDFDLLEGRANVELLAIAVYWEVEVFGPIGKYGGSGINHHICLGCYSVFMIFCNFTYKI